MKIILRKKFVLVNTFWGPSISGSVQLAGFAGGVTETQSACRDREECIGPPETSPAPGVHPGCWNQL